jgi:hypothetical protein
MASDYLAGTRVLQVRLNFDVREWAFVTIMALKWVLSANEHVFLQLCEIESPRASFERMCYVVHYR